MTANRTPRWALEEALTTLDPGTVLGFVFNGADHSVSGYYSGYSYRSDFSTEPPSSNGHSGAVLKRTLRKFGDSVWRYRQPPEAAQDRFHGGRR